MLRSLCAKAPTNLQKNDHTRMPSLEKSLAKPYPAWLSAPCHYVFRSDTGSAFRVLAAYGMAMTVFDSPRHACCDPPQSTVAIRRQCGVLRDVVQRQNLSVGLSYTPPQRLLINQPCIP